MRLRLEERGVREVTAGLVNSATLAPAKAYGVVVHHAMLVQRRVQANASGRPGPRSVTGDYRRSIRRRSRPVVAGGYSDIGTDAPQGRRLEVGFVGTDSAGRRYRQRPFPHFGPALDDSADPFADGLAAAVVPG